jgi:hypothetical protein
MALDLDKYIKFLPACTPTTDDPYGPCSTGLVVYGDRGQYSTHH